MAVIRTPLPPKCEGSHNEFFIFYLWFIPQPYCFKSVDCRRFADNYKTNLRYPFNEMHHLPNPNLVHPLSIVMKKLWIKKLSRN